MIEDRYPQSSILDLQSLLRSHGAALLRYVLLKLFPVLFYERRRRHGRGISKGTNRVAHDVAADVENQIEITASARARLDPVENFFHPVTALAAGAALAAGFMSEKAREVPGGADHASGFVHHNNTARAKQTSGGLHRFVIEGHVLELGRTQHRHRSAAENDAFELSAVGHAAAVFLKKFDERITHLHFVNAGFADMAAYAEELRAFALFCSHSGIGRGAVLENPRKRRQGLDVIDHRGAAEKPMSCRKRRLNLRPTSAAFQ